MGKRVNYKSTKSKMPLIWKIVLALFAGFWGFILLRFIVIMFFMNVTMESNSLNTYDITVEVNEVRDASGLTIDQILYCTIVDVQSKTDKTDKTENAPKVNDKIILYHDMMHESLNEVGDRIELKMRDGQVFYGLRCAYEIYDPDKMGYKLLETHEVNGRQGVCSEGDFFWVSGSKTLEKYDKNWNLICENTDPFKGYDIEVNHIADIDVYNNELYIGAEYFMDGVGKNIQIAVYDGDTLELKRTFPFEPESGQLECSGIAVDSESNIVWMCSWVGGESGEHLYKYDLESGKYLGKVKMDNPPKWIHGIACYNGRIYITSDDGDADKDEPDHIYQTSVSDADDTCSVYREISLYDVKKQGEIEGLTFDKNNNQLLILYNRGARIVEGMPTGFYEGYDKEISEVYVYKLPESD